MAAGIFRLLREVAPEVAEAETRTLTLFDEGGEVPAGEYGFAEAFCGGPTCDCRRVLFMVFRRDPGGGEPDHALTISYGWEPLEFYQRWAHDDGIGEQLEGPAIDLTSPLPDYGQALLELFDRRALSSPDDVDRVRRHYAHFKERIGA